MFFGATLMMVTNLAFALLASVGRDFEVLAAVVFFDNLSGGMATTAVAEFVKLVQWFSAWRRKYARSRHLATSHEFN